MLVFDDVVLETQTINLIRYTAVMFVGRMDLKQLTLHICWYFCSKIFSTLTTSCIGESVQFVL